MVKCRCMVCGHEFTLSEMQDDAKCTSCGSQDWRQLADDENTLPVHVELVMEVGITIGDESIDEEVAKVAKAIREAVKDLKTTVCIQTTRREYTHLPF